MGPFFFFVHFLHLVGLNIATSSKNGKVPICLMLLEVILLWESLSQRGWQLEIKGISVNRRILCVSRKVCPSWSHNINGLLCFLKLCYAFKPVKFGVSRKTALGEDCFLVSDFSWCHLTLLFPSLLSSKERMISRVTKAILETQWLREKEHGEFETLLSNWIEWLQLLHWMWSQHLGRMIGGCVGQEIMDWKPWGCSGKLIA